VQRIRIRLNALFDRSDHVNTPSYPAIAAEANQANRTGIRIVMRLPLWPLSSGNDYSSGLVIGQDQRVARSRNRVAGGDHPACKHRAR
jgi:hypothetical protein